MPVYSLEPINIKGWKNFNHEEMIDDTHSAIVFDNGEVMSVQPNGTIETRPAGTFGAYEVARREGSLRFYTPDDSLWIFVVA